MDDINMVVQCNLNVMVVCMYLFKLFCHCSRLFTST